VIIPNGKYIAHRLSGFSSEMKKESFELYDFNQGDKWRNPKSKVI
jgi:hypothetical protein